MRQFTVAVRCLRQRVLGVAAGEHASARTSCAGCALWNAEAALSRVAAASSAGTAATARMSAAAAPAAAFAMPAK